MARQLVVVAVWLTACGSAGSGSSEAREACREAFVAVDTAADLESANREIFARCADLHAAPACREAWRTAAEVSPDARVAVAAAGCRRAYCNELEAPRPALCDHPIDSLPPSVLGEEWAELERRVITREHGDEGAPFASVMIHLAPTGVPLELPPEPEAEAEETVTLGLRRDATGLVVIRIEDTGDRRAVLADIANTERDSEALRPLLVGVDRVSIAADESLPYRDVVRVIDAVRAAGVQRFAIAVNPGDDTAP